MSRKDWKIPGTEEAWDNRELGADAAFVAVAPEPQEAETFLEEMTPGEREVFDKVLGTVVDEITELSDNVYAPPNVVSHIVEATFWHLSRMACDRFGDEMHLPGAGIWRRVPPARIPRERLLDLAREIREQAAHMEQDAEWIEASPSRMEVLDAARELRARAAAFEAEAREGAWR